MTSSNDEFVDQLRGSRERLELFAQACSDADWCAGVSHDDDRTVGVTVDHVADSYEYLAGWVRDLVNGTHPEVNTRVVDELNARHAERATDVGREQAVVHLRTSGGAFVDLVRGLGPEELQLEDGRVRRFIEIAIRHADDHRSALESGLDAGAR